MGLVDDEVLGRICDLAAEAQILGESWRRSLFDGIDAEAVALIDRHDKPALQLRADLRWCNDHKLADGRFPLVRWLKNAARLTGPMAQGKGFARFHEHAAQPAVAPVTEDRPARATTTPETRASPRPRVFISYARAEKEIALQFRQALGRDCDVSIDLEMPITAVWANWIKTAISDADVFVVLLSGVSMGRDMVEAEVETAWRRHGEAGTPRIAVVRLRDNAPLEIPFSGYLGKFNHVQWESDADTPMDRCKHLRSGHFARSAIADRPA